MKITNRFYRVVPLLVLFSLSACVTMPAKQQAINQTISWQQRQSDLSAINTWTVRGAIGVHNQKNGWSASVNWQQQADHYQLQLYGPLGAGQIRLNGTPGHVTLLTANNKKSEANSGDRLLYQQTGWNLPVDNFYYWIRGIPAPSLPANQQLDGYNHLQQLQQQGWTIHYTSYTAVNGVDLPNKIELSSGNVKIRLVISSWLIKKST